MTVYALGSITAIDEFEVPRLPGRTDVLTALDRSRSLGGQGVLQSVAIDRAGAKVRHIGAIGSDGAWLKKAMQDIGLKTTNIATMAGPSGQTILQTCAGHVEQTLNAPGVNLTMTEKHIERSMRGIESDDWLLLHGETNGQKQAIALAKAAGAKVAYYASPFDIGAVSEVVQDIDILIVTEQHAKEIEWAFQIESIMDFKAHLTLVLKDDLGGILHHRDRRQTARTNAIEVEAVDKTATKEVFVGYFLAALDQGIQPTQALINARFASVVKAKRAGGLDAIPTAKEVAASRTPKA